jgi:NTE family protein
MAERVALVLAGGGARGAYEAGALSVLLPVLEARGERPALLLGTSVGAVNVAFLAGAARRPAAEAAELALARWREVSRDRVLGPLWRLRGGRERPAALLDPSPLHQALEEWIDWPALAANAEDGVVAGVGAVATAASSGRPVVFLAGPAAREPAPPGRIAVVPARLSAQHVRASAAIPTVFPPERVDQPPEAAGWYFDGGTRLNTPIEPALDLGADRLVVVATDCVASPAEGAAPPQADRAPPGFGQSALHLLQGALVDPLVEDLRRLGATNELLAGAEGRQAADAWRRARGRPPLRTVPYVAVAPARSGLIGELAAEAMGERRSDPGQQPLRGPRRTGPRRRQHPLRGRLQRWLAADPATNGELLSYLFFEPDFIARLLELGRADAERWLAEQGGQPWRTRALA